MMSREVTIMPIYEYQCEACGTVSEIMQKMSDSAPETCSSCGEKNQMHRLISRTSFVLKGTGWYETDFKDKRSKKSNGNGKANQSTPADTKTDTTATPAASAETNAPKGDNGSSKSETKTTKKADSKPASQPSAT